MGNHTSYYVNVGQIVTVVVGGICVFEYIRYLEHQAGMSNESVGDILVNNIKKFRNRYNLY